MTASLASSEIYLLPGELHFGDRDTPRIHTVLGSCVSITLWHPVLRSGGMCHFVLPSRGKPGSHELDGRYADEAIELILREVGQRKAFPGDYRVKLFGGGNMFQHAQESNTFNVAGNNIEAARTLLHANGFEIQAEHVGGSGHRRVIFDLSSGRTWIRHEKIPGARRGASEPISVTPMAGR